MTRFELPLRNLVPFSSYFYPVLDPPIPRRGYKLNLYDHFLVEGVMLYEIYKPGEEVPYTILITSYENHLAFFYALWNLDEFDTCAADRHFMMRAWHHLCPSRGPWNPAVYDISIEHEEMDEPRLYRAPATDLIVERYEIEDSEEDQEQERIKECIGRFCMLPIS